MSPAMAIYDEVRDEDEKYQRGVKQLYENGNLHKVPKKYILPPSDRPVPTRTNMMEDPNVGKKQKLQLPIIDFADLLGPNRPQALQSLAIACEHYGFFQVINHGVSDEVARGMMDVCGRFFNEPYEERAKYMSGDMRAPVRYGTSFNQTKDTAFTWRDFLKLMCHPLPDLLPHWPSSPLDFRKVASRYAEETKELFLAIMEAVEESLGIKKEEEMESSNKGVMRELLEKGGSQMVVANLYPPCPEPDLTLGMPAHSDYGFLTLVLQDEVEGLQIQHQGKWLTVQPIPNAFVVNVGDHLEIYSNGKYKSVLHRVLVNEVKTRMSVASLHSLPFDCTVKPSPRLINEANPKRYMDTDFASFLAYVSTREIKKKDFLESRKLAYS